MAKDYVVIKGQANIIRNETAEGGNTAAEVGGAIYDVADKLEEVDGTLTSAIGTKLPISSVVDNLTSTSTTAPACTRPPPRTASASRAPAWSTRWAPTSSS